MDWVELSGLARDQSAVNEFQTLLQSYKEDPDKWKKIIHTTLTTMVAITWME